MLIHLDFPSISTKLASAPAATYSFRLTSKNCNPDFGKKYGEPAPFNPYFRVPATKVSGTGYTGSRHIRTYYSAKDFDSIMTSTNDYALLLCSNPVHPPFVLEHHSSTQAGGFVSPFFFKDVNVSSSKLKTTDELTFFVQPELVASTVKKTSGYGVPPFKGREASNDDDDRKNLRSQRKHRQSK